MFRRSADIYDAIYGYKDYAGEAERVNTLIQERLPGASDLLDVACGTGKHLEQLRRWYTVEGLDIEDALLEVARRRLCDIPLHQADMTSFRLGRSFDAVTCLFSAIGYVGTLERLRLATATMAAHLAPGGLLVLEPWLMPEVWVERRPQLLTVDEPDLKIARMHVSAREGRLAIMDFAYLVGRPAGLEQFSERQEAALFTDAEYRDALESAGLSVEYDPHGLIGRGLYLGRNR